MNIILNKLNNESGYTLPIVIIVLVVFAILFTSTIVILKSNTKQITTQENNLKAHYLARAGVDLAYAALMQEDSSPSYYLKINRLIDDGNPIIHNELALPKDDPIGHVDVTALLDGDEVKIYANATMNNNQGTSTIAMYIKKDDFSKTRWSKK